MSLTYKWVWAGDSKKGSQDIWIEYDNDVAEKIEKAFNKGQKTMKLDADRYIDFSDPTTILQRRYPLFDAMYMAFVCTLWFVVCGARVYGARVYA